MKPVLDHIGIAVKSLDTARIYSALGFSVDRVESVESQGVKTAFIAVGDQARRHILLLLIFVSADDDRPLGLHHLRRLHQRLPEIGRDGAD